MMGKIAIPAIVGVVAVAVLAGGYYGALHYHLPLDPVTAMIGAAILMFGAAIAVFTLVAMNRAGNAPAYQRLRLSEMPAKRSISFFHDAEKLQFVARPEASVGEILVKHGDMSKNTPGALDKKIVLTIKASKRAIFNPRILRQLFAALAPQLEHVILMSDGDAFVGYIPGPRALKEFTGDNAESKIGACIIDVLKEPTKESSVKALRGLGGITSSETVDETDFVRQATAKMYLDENCQGFLIHRHLKPVGMITKVELFALASSEAFIAGI